MRSPASESAAKFSTSASAVLVAFSGPFSARDDERK
jgi:hypothetical protein